MPPLGDLARAVVPTRCRRWLRRAAVLAPQRLRDLPADLASLAAPRAFGGPLPPPSLRARVGQLSRRVFRSVGIEGSRQIEAAFSRARVPRLARLRVRLRPPRALRRGAP